MKRLLLLLSVFGLAYSQELPLRRVLEDSLKNNLEVSASEKDLKSASLELKATRGLYLPRLKIEEIYTNTNLPVYAFMGKLNQERISAQDFNPSKLNDPSSVSNFETKFTLEIPIWLGGKIQAYNKATEENLKMAKSDLLRKREEVVLKTYQAYADASLAKSSIQVSRQALEDAKEHLKLAESMHKAGIVLFSDILRAQVYVSKAQEMLTQSENNYTVAKRALELITNTKYGDFDVEEPKECPGVNLDDLRAKALEREDIKSLSFKINSMREMSKTILSDNLPQVYAFGNYSINSKSFPFGRDGDGYTIGLGISWTFDTGLSTYNRYLAHLEKVKAMEDRLKLLVNSVDLDIERSHAGYENALQSARSARDRIAQSEEVLRIVKERYKVGLARMIDILDAQTELDRARFEYNQALNACHKAYINLLYSGGKTMEVLR